jgi:hypothetical protein
MTRPLHLAALVAMVPAMLGSQHGRGEALMLRLCGGGTLDLELPGKRAPDPDGKSCEKGCHSGCSRKRIDRAQ